MSVAGAGRSESNPPPMHQSSASSPSPTPSEVAITLAKQLTNGIDTTTTTITSNSSKHSLLEQNQQPIDISSHPINNSSINFFLDHDDDLGFDPFTGCNKNIFFTDKIAIKNLQKGWNK